MIDHRWECFLIGWGAAALLMLVLWLIQVKTRDASHVDVGWAAGLGLVAILSGALGGGDASHRVLIAVLGGLWGTRLALHLLFNRVLGKEEDGRYRTLRAKWAPHEDARFFVFFQAQAGFVAAFSLPYVFAAYNGADGIEPLEWAGTALLLAGVIGEVASDRQLAGFRANPANRGKTCRAGLWRYSRHPNYFFAWLSWIAFALVALAAPWGWLALLTPAFLLFLLFFVTGIPPTEKQALESRGDDYRRYQEETSVFVPWFPKKQRRAA